MDPKMGACDPYGVNDDRPIPGNLEVSLEVGLTLACTWRKGDESSDPDFVARIQRYLWLRLSMGVRAV